MTNTIENTQGIDPKADTDAARIDSELDASARLPKRATGSGVVVARTDVEWLGRYLLGTWAEVRLAARELTARPEMQRIEGQSVDEHRERVFGQLKLLVEDGQVHRAFPKSVGGEDDHGATSRASRSSSPPIRACRSSRACSGACSAPPCCTSAPSTTTAPSCPAS